ncbi:MAG: type IV pilus assembly protein PilM [Patescibacteria group bacterium]|nr:type IV pilus assembly protein PilM [Patescibacteria group bacterium]
MFEFLKLNPDAFGLDISDASLKILKLKKKGNYFDLDFFGEQSIEHGVIEEGKIKKEKILAKIIRNALNKIKGKKIKTKHVFVSLSEKKSFSKVIKMPLMEEEELKKAIFFETENYIPFSIKNVYLDFQIVPPIYKHIDHLDVLITAMPKKIIDPYLSCVKKADLLPIIIETNAQSMARALVENELSPLPILLIDLGPIDSTLVVFYGHSLRFTSSISISSQKFNESISMALSVDAKKADRLKTKYGVGKPKSKEGKRVFNALIPCLTDLREQINKYIDYYYTHTVNKRSPSDERKIEKVYLSGEGANLNGLPDFLSMELKIPVKKGNPWANILEKPFRSVPELSFERSLGYTAALGLALRAIKHK